MKKAQVSIEYLIILGLTVAIILGAVYVFVDYVRGSTVQVINSRVNTLGTELVQKSEAMYSIGDGTWVVIDIEYPGEISTAYTVDYMVGNNARSELVLVVNSSVGTSESVFFSDINITGAGPLSNGKRSLGRVQPGKATFKIESKGDYVLLNSS